MYSLNKDVSSYSIIWLCNDANKALHEIESLKKIKKEKKKKKKEEMLQFSALFESNI